ncbi:MAG: serine/threonine protein kinase [candidate division Zixibacteria bacterium]|nr:serine/threonine protein kinase [candidate division Zixibacteria bacterium]
METLIKPTYMNELETLQKRIEELTSWPIVHLPKIITNTSEPMKILRGQVLRLDGRDFVIEGNQYETRFGIADQPKYWVFSAIELETGKKKIIKTVFHEDFNVHIGVFKIHCYRSPEKEADVLELVKGDRRFMQGYTILDEFDNNTRVIDFIRGKTIFQHIYSIDKSHREYFTEDLPDILYNLIGTMEAIQHLHENNLCHGDIRNDHIIIERDTGKYRWIDFDLKQHVADFDVWSMGNILNYAVGKGINSFKLIMRSDDFTDSVKSTLEADDASAFYEYRIMNLKKLYPYIPDSLSDILMHFAVRPRGTYSTIKQLLDDYRVMLNKDFPR